MNFVSLFAGVGGFDLAFERAGMNCVGQVEIDAKCREVLAKHWPEVPRFEDVHEVSGLDDLGSVDVLCGGFPCQDYSVAGKRGGLVGDRGALWWQFHRLVAECRPRWVVGENVPGLLSSNDGQDFGAIVGSLVELGYGVVWRVLDAQYFGVAQRRRRVFIVGHLGGIPRPEILAFAEGCSGDTPPSRQPGTRPTGTLAARTTAGGGLGTDTELDGGLIPYHKMNAEAGWGEGLSTLRARDGKGDANLLATLQEVGARESKNQNGVGIGIADPNLMFTLQAGQQHGMAFTSGVRRLTPLECERLQGFPDNWTAGQSDTQRYRQMGNAVAVPVVEWIGRNLVTAQVSTKERR